MPPEITNDQELGLKKRARRRLVGAIALVVLMMIILPIILQDRAAITPKEAITITMPESLDADSVNVTQQAAVVENVPALPEPPIKEGEMPVATEPPPNASSTTPNNQSSSSEPGVKADNLKAEAEIIETDVYKRQHPYPMMVRDFQAIIGIEAKEQMIEMVGRQPDAIVACVGGGSNAMGIFYPYIDVPNVRLIGVEAAGHGLETGMHAAPLTANSPVGVLHGNRTYLMQDTDGNIIETHSISAGLDYPGVGPEHAWLKDIKRAEYVAITDDEAMAAFHNLCRTEGIIPALESSHALAHAEKMAKTMRKDEIILVNLSGRGDKDINTVAKLANITL